MGDALAAGDHHLTLKRADLEGGALGARPPPPPPAPTPHPYFFFK